MTNSANHSISPKVTKSVNRAEKCPVLPQSAAKKVFFCIPIFPGTFNILIKCLTKSVLRFRIFPGPGPIQSAWKRGVRCIHTIPGALNIFKNKLLDKKIY